MADETEPATPGPTRPARRRASRAAGPATGVRIEPAGTVKVRTTRSAPLRRPPAPLRRRPAHRMLAGVMALVLGVATTGAMALVVWLGLLGPQHRAEATEARNQRFVDTASQTVQNMFSYTQNNIDESVNRFVDGTSGPLRDMLSQDNNVENLKAMFRDTNATSEAVINGAALEKIDDQAKEASVLVSVRVTVTDLDGVNKPSQPYRLRLIVREDDNGNMTSYDLKYPEGGN